MKNIEKIALVITLFGLFLLPACGSKEKASEKAAEKAIENATGADVDIQKDGEKVVIESDGQKTVIETGDKSWPAAIPDEVPEFKSGKITHTTHSETPDGENWTVIYEGISGTDLDNYNKALKAAGFKTTSIRMGDGGSVGGEKGKIIVSSMFGDGKGVVGVTVNAREDQ